jgi:2-succinyl-5-enolpyruvyl-6-hydroxy-3-cyclohexene-1-carboxylate synthase
LRWSARSLPKRSWILCAGCSSSEEHRTTSAQAFGPEFIAKALKRWLAASGVGTLYIEPGSPWENAFHEKVLSVKADVAAVTPSETATLAPLLMLPSALSVGSFW